MRTVLSLVVVLALVAVACAPDDAEEAADEAVAECDEHTIQLSHITAEGSTWDRAGERFGEIVDEGSDGRIEVTTYPNSQLAGGNQQAELEQVQDGVIDSLWVSPIILALFMDERFDIYSLPFLFPDHETANAVIDGEVGEMTEEWVREGGLEPLGWGVNGFRQLTNDVRPVTEPADLEGLQVRVAGTDLFLETFSLLGADPLTMDFGEVFTSLQQGVIDGQENPLDIIHTSSLYEVQGYLTLWDYSYDPLVLSMNADTFAEFCAEDRELLSEAATEAGQYQRDIAAEEEATILDELEAQGMEIIPADEIDVDAFREAVQEPIWGEWEDVIGADEIEMIVDAVEDAR